MNKFKPADYLSQQMQVAPYSDGKYYFPVVWVHEQFRQVPIPLLERYYISNFGRLFDTEKMCHCIPTIRERGSVWYTIRWGHNGVNDFCQKSAQWFMMMTFKPIPDTTGKYIVFLDHDPSHLVLDNMQWMTYSQKQQYMADEGIGSVGENHYQTKYTEEQTRMVSELLSKGFKANKIKELIGDKLPEDPNFNEYCVRLRTKRGWKHVVNDYDMELLNKRFPDEFIHNVCKLLEQDKSNKEIAQILGVEYNVRLQSLCAGLRGRKPAYKKYWELYPNIPLVTAESRGISMDMLEEIIKRISNGYTTRQIVDELGPRDPHINMDSVQKTAKRLKYPKDKNVKGYDLAKKYGIIQNNI